ncbi:hypothetical protein MPSEU_000963200 [Mayamaea pseudoterrestris]|nr:hypothetical protein MPSEU_000963200 [Mayamaea pseudoterrestris]
MPKTVQRYVRGNIVRSNLRSLSSSACEIQRVWRGYLEFCKFTCDRWAAVRIQTVLRVALAKNYLDQLYLEQDIQFIRRKSSALAIQRRFRLYIWERLQRSAASTIQSSVRRFLARCRSKRQRYGLVRLQSFARAHHVRRKRDKATRILANKIAKANKNAIKNPGMRLNNRCSAALSVLQTSHRLAQVASAIKTLETATKLSEVCCQSFTDAGAARIILNLISTCNRSLPHVEILHSTMQALTNVAKYEYLLPSLATQLAVETFLNLVQMFRDKESIFTLTTALLERVVFYQKSLLTICKAKDNVKRLHGIVALCERRTGLDHNASALNGRRVTRLSLVNDSSKGLRSLKRIIAAASIV